MHSIIIYSFSSTPMWSSICCLTPTVRQQQHAWFGSPVLKSIFCSHYRCSKVRRLWTFNLNYVNQIISKGKSIKGSNLLIHWLLRVRALFDRILHKLYERMYHFNLAHFQIFAVLPFVYTPSILKYKIFWTNETLPNMINLCPNSYYLEMSHSSKIFYI